MQRSTICAVSSHLRFVYCVAFGLVFIDIAGFLERDGNENIMSLLTMLPLLLVYARLNYIWWQQCEKDSFSSSVCIRPVVTTSRNPSYDLTLNSTDSTTRETLLRQ